MKTLILCGGKGSRSYPFTEYFPKVMMPIAGTPILVHLMRIFAGQGFTDFVLAAGHRKEILVDYFHGRFSEWKVDIVDTGEDADTAERLQRCAGHLNGPFLATYGDGLGNVDLRELTRFHSGHGAVATVTTVALRCQYGTLIFDSAGRVSHFVEKPVIEDCCINAGFFVFNREIFSHIRGPNLESHVLPSLAARGQLFAYRHPGFWKSMDTSKDQQEMEALYRAGDCPPWLLPAKTSGESHAA